MRFTVDRLKLVLYTLCRYYYLELCNASLDQVYLDDDNPKKYRGPLPSKEDILLQLAKGMKHVHDNKLVYQKAKPQNVLIYSTKSSSSVLVKWADFGLTIEKPKIRRSKSSQDFDPTSEIPKIVRGLVRSDSFRLLCKN